MAVDAARLATFKAYTAVVRGGAYSGQAARREFMNLDAQGRRFAMKLLGEALDRLVFIDYVLDGRVDYERTDHALIDMVRLGVCQIYFLDSVPDHAAIDTTVELAREKGFERQTGFINGVLRNVLRARERLSLPEREQDPARYLSVKHAWPQWMAYMFIKQLGFDDAEGFMAYRPTHHMTLRPNGLKGVDAAGLSKALDAAGATYTRGKIIKDAFLMEKVDKLTSSNVFTQGGTTVQGEGSQIVSWVCAQVAGPGAHILDACAAPGGKSAAIAHYLNGECHLDAWDIHEHRLELIRQTFARLGVKGAIELHDAGLSKGGQFDVVLVDAPCSGLGIAYNSPDIKLQRKQKDMDGLIALQRRILKNCVALVKPGGALLYSTCTVSQRENEDNVAWLLEQNRGLKPLGLDAYLPQGVSAGGHCLQLLPHVHETEGFFMALMRKDDD